MFIILAILAFGFIIAIHELGHFISARIFNVKVNEFAIGMGPKLLKRQGKETLYSLRAVPFGGFCAMEGEHEEGEEPDPRSFLNQKRWRRIVILASGSIANLITAFIIILILTTGLQGFAGTTITDINEDFSTTGPTGLIAGDKIISVNDERLYYYDDFRLVMQLNQGNAVKLIVERNGEQIKILSSTEQLSGLSTTLSTVIDNFPEMGSSELRTGDRIIAVNGEIVYTYSDYLRVVEEHRQIEGNENEPISLILERDGEHIEYISRAIEIDGVKHFRYSLAFEPNIRFTFNRIDANFGEVIKYSVYQTYSFMRMIRLSVAMMISGSASIRDVAGPVGIINTMNTIGQEVNEAQGISAAIGSIVFFTAFIGINVGIINLLPIPAMDGGRILFTVLSWIIEKIIKKPLHPKYEGYINTGAFVLLIGLMIVILYNDVVNIFGFRS